eukprot:10355694-Ditylum_brightwellii.AAC.1
MCHNKGEKESLGHDVRIISLFNKFNKFDELFPPGIVSLRIDADGVQSCDRNLIHHMANSVFRLKPYLQPGANIQISSFTTYAGGGGGTKES